MGLYRHIGRPLGTVDQVSVVTVWYIKGINLMRKRLKHISKLEVAVAMGYGTAL